MRGLDTLQQNIRKTFLEDGDIEEALSAAHAVSDDAIQSWKCKDILFLSPLHGTSEQRKYWFMKGYKTGDIKQGQYFCWDE
jgi:predicted metalloprotease